MEFIETPELQKIVKDNLSRYYDVLNSQLFLQEQGVSFSYTDAIPFYEREDLISVYKDFIELKNQKNQEILDKKKR